MRVGLFGGTFDPIHYGHLLLADAAREQCDLDEIWFVPAAVPPHKQDAEVASGEARAEMIELAVAGNPGMLVSRFELQRGGVSYTVDTLRHFRGETPDAELFFLMGADMLHDLPNWREADMVCRLAIPIVADRPGSGQLDYRCLAAIATAERIALFRDFQIEMPQIDLSSSEIRLRVAQGRSIRYRTPRAVQKYIEVHGLYLTD
ncbi:MAG: nicotinate-nucleotide adenylyltransferase [Thermoguttaceae bacterium]